MRNFVSNTYAISSLIIANLVTLYGAWFLGWHVFFIMLIYWCESAIIGAFTIVKIRKAEGQASTTASWSLNGKPVDPSNVPFFQSFLIGFFLLHYGIFMLVHVIFLFAFFFRPGFSVWSFLAAVSSLVLSHAISYQTNFLQGMEYKKLSPDALFFSPYPRIIVMHITVIAGGGIALESQEPKYALAIMIILKILADLASHLLQHGLLRTKVSSTTSSQTPTPNYD